MDLFVLIVEDEDSVIEMYRRTSNTCLEDTSIKLHVTKNKNDAIAAFNANLTIVAAIIDLQLEKNDGNNSDGNIVISEIITKKLFPIYVVSGNPDRLQEGFKTHPHITLKVKSEDPSSIFDEIKSKYDIFCSQIKAQKESINNHIDNIVWKHLYEKFYSLTKKQTDSILVEKQISRIINHTLAEYFDSKEYNIQDYLPEEYYIAPPIKEDFSTCDIVYINNEKSILYIILNPACDLIIQPKKIVPKAQYLNLCAIIDVKNIANWLHSVGKDTGPTENQINTIVDKIKKNEYDAYHYIPSYKEEIPFESVIDFQNIKTLPMQKKVELVRVASIILPFRKNISARFSAYYARQGQPNLIIT
jgi:hypothetical protein